MVYVDTSIIVKLYTIEKNSKAAADKIKQYKKAIPLTPLHDLEFLNALRLKQFRSEISKEDIEKIISRFNSHEISGIYYRPQLDWADVFITASNLSEKHTKKIGSRFLDILHVASALVIEADRFFSADAKQARLASAAGIKVDELKT